jgi:hypothetical protein
LRHDVPKTQRLVAFWREFARKAGVIPDKALRLSQSGCDTVEQPKQQKASLKGAFAAGIQPVRG